jgi:hypothetical protein
MTLLVILSVIVIVAFAGVLAAYLYWVGSLLGKIATNLEESSEIVGGIVGDAKLIIPGVDHINRTGGVVAGALPLLYGMAEGIVKGVTPLPPRPDFIPPAFPASGTRRSRLLAAVGFGDATNHGHQ